MNKSFIKRVTRERNRENGGRAMKFLPFSEGSYVRNCLCVYGDAISPSEWLTLALALCIEKDK